MDVVVITHPRCEHRQRLDAAVREVNQLQRFFRLRSETAKWLPNDESGQRSVNSAEVHDLIRQRMRGRRVIAVTQSGLTPDLFVDERRTASLITMADWEDVYAPPPLTVYLLYQFASALINFGADLSDHQIEQWPHRPAIGCFFDWYRTARELRRCMVAANLCGACEVRLAGMGLPDEALQAVEQILNVVRHATIRRPRSTPMAVFIGHGRKAVWEDVRDFVQVELGLPVQEFNQEATAGVATTERLESMLAASAFAILVMTAEDRHDDRRLHARENVVHEIGLFQGRLGFQRALVLKEAKAISFSNLHGMTYVELPTTPFAAASDAKSAIRRALEREGLLVPASMEAPRREAARPRLAARKRDRSA